MYQLKKGTEAFTAVEGPFAGRTFEPGKSYDDVPPGDVKKFTEINEEAEAGAEKAAKAESKRAASPSEKGEVKS